MFYDDIQKLGSEFIEISRGDAVYITSIVFKDLKTTQLAKITKVQ